MKILANRNTIQGLVTYYISLLIFLASCIGVWTSQAPLSVIVFALSLCTMLIQDVEWIRRSRVHPQDKLLIEKISATLYNNRSDLFLKERDFSQYIYEERELEPLLDLKNWQGVDYEFINPTYRQIFSAMKDELAELLDLLLNQYSMKGMGFYHLNKEHKTREVPVDAKTRAINAATANRLARSVYDRFQVFRRIYLEKMQSVKTAN